MSGLTVRELLATHEAVLSGTRVQIKCRVVRVGNAGERMLSPFRSFDFDTALIILFDRAYEVSRAARLSAEQVQSLSTWRRHVNGHILIARDRVLDLGVDVTAMFRESRHELPDPGPALGMQLARD